MARHLQTNMHVKLCI